jgi:hypothetical protein
MKNIYILIPTDSYGLNLFKSLVYIIQFLCVKKSSQFPKSTRFLFSLNLILF